MLGNQKVIWQSKNWSLLRVIESYWIWKRFEGSKYLKFYGKLSLLTLTFPRQSFRSIFISNQSRKVCFINHFSVRENDPFRPKLFEAFYVDLHPSPIGTSSPSCFENDFMQDPEKVLWVSSKERKILLIFHWAPFRNIIWIFLRR